MASFFFDQFGMMNTVKTIDSSLLKAISHYGNQTSSFVTAYSHFQSYWNEYGLIRFQSRGSYRVCANEPLSSTRDQVSLYQSFVQESEESELIPLMTPVGDRLAQELSLAGFGCVQIGAEPIFELDSYLKKEPLSFLPMARSLKRRGYQVEMKDFDGLTVLQKKSLEQMTEQWKERLGAPLGFLNEIDPFQLSEYKKIFILTLGKRVHAFITAVPIFPENAYYLMDVIRAPHARNGSSELLIIEAMKQLHNLGIEQVRLGMSPLALIEKKDIKTRFLDLVFQKIQSGYAFKNHFRYKNKFRPSRWDPKYLIFPKKKFLSSLWGVLSIHHRHGILYSMIGRYLKNEYQFKLPLTGREYLKKSYLTHFIVLFLFGMYAYKMSVSGSSLFAQVGFYPDQWSLKSVFIGPLFHNTAYHLLGDLSTLWLFSTFIENIFPKKILLLILGLGLWISNPITALILNYSLPVISPHSVSFYQNFVDYGSSNAVYALAAATGMLLKNPRWVIAPFFLNAVIYALLAQKWLALHHLVAMGMGAFVSFLVIRNKR